MKLSRVSMAMLVLGTEFKDEYKHKVYYLGLNK